MLKNHSLWSHHVLIAIKQQHNGQNDISSEIVYFYIVESVLYFILVEKLALTISQTVAVSEYEGEENPLHVSQVSPFGVCPSTVAN